MKLELKDNFFFKYPNKNCIGFLEKENKGSY